MIERVKPSAGLAAFFARLALAFLAMFVCFCSAGCADTDLSGNKVLSGEEAGEAGLGDGARSLGQDSNSETSPSEDQNDGTSIKIKDPLALPAETIITDEELEATGEDAFFTVRKIDDALFSRMKGKTYKSDCTVPRSELRYVRVLHADKDGRILSGEIVVNKAIAKEIRDIFRELFDSRYPIERMRLADDYDGDDIASMEDNNTSGFNYRPIEGTNRPSKHGLGMAIDINTFYNPYHRFSDNFTSPEGSVRYLNRSKDFTYKIEEGDLCHRLFKKHGYTWGGDWTSLKDYQHFEK